MKVLLLVFFISFLSIQNNRASLFRWDLQITNPDFELKNIQLGEKSHKPYLEKTSWRCWTHQTEKKGSQEIKSLSCSYSIKKTGRLTTLISCSPERPYSEGTLELYDERKNLTFKIMLICRKK